MAQTNNLPQLYRPTSMTVALRNADERQVLALTNSLSLRKRLTDERKRAELESELDTLKRSERWFLRQPYSLKHLFFVQNIRKQQAEIIATLQTYEPIVSLAAAAKYNRAMVLLDIESLLAKLLREVEVSGKMKHSALELYAEEVLGTYGYLAIEDLALCFRYALNGEYGEIWRLDKSVINKWLKSYWQELEQARAQTNQDRYHANQDSKHAPRMSEQQERKASEVINEWKQKQLKQRAYENHHD